MARQVRVATWVALLLAVAWPARGEIVYLTSGRTLSVRAHRIEGEDLVLVLRSGGEVTCPRALVQDIVPDEVPYPEPDGKDQDRAEAPGRTGWPESTLLALVARLSARHGLDPRLVHAVVTVESSYRPEAVSPRGAMGLMQLMPETARRYAVVDPFDPHANLDAGIRHLKRLLGRFDLPLALAAYNAGEHAVKRFGGIPPYRETREYVSRILERLGRP